MIRKILLILLFIAFQGCFPSFGPKKESIQIIETDNSFIEWYRLIGILDQKFPDHIVMQRLNSTDTICKAYNIANVQVGDNRIIIGFYGKPSLPNNFDLRKNFLDFNIEDDTTYTLTSNVQN